jgi:3-hydroxybutyryl-CoA dehydrogenase
LPRSKEQVSSSLKFMDKLLAKDVSKGKIQDIEAKEARDRITVLDYDTQGIEGFRDADMVIEVTSSIPVHVCFFLTILTGRLRKHTT